MAALLGVLASIALPNYVRVVERARVSEAKKFIAALVVAQQEFALRNGAYMRSAAQWKAYASKAPLKHYNVEITTGRCRRCSDRFPDWGVRLTRTGRAPARYGRYAVEFTRCFNRIEYPGCRGTGALGAADNCLQDFDGITEVNLVMPPPVRPDHPGCR